MPNWCFSNMTFIGDKEDVIKLHDTLLELKKGEPSIETSFGNLWLGNVLSRHGFDINNDKFRCRGWIEEIGDSIIERDSYSFFQIMVATAWMPMTDMWDAILEKHYPSMSYVYIAEESNSGVFVNTDVDGEFYTSRYLLDFCKDFSQISNESECEYGYFAKKEDVIKYLEKITKKTFNTLESALEYMEEYCENGGFNFHEFESA